jgi:hypothetical protein
VLKVMPSLGPLVSLAKTSQRRHPLFEQGSGDGGLTLTASGQVHRAVDLRRGVGRDVLSEFTHQVVAPRPQPT